MTSDNSKALHEELDFLLEQRCTPAPFDGPDAAKSFQSVRDELFSDDSRFSPARSRLNAGEEVLSVHCDVEFDAVVALDETSGLITWLGLPLKK